MAASSQNRLSLFSLSAPFIGSMIGAGNFSLPRTFAVATSPFGAIIAWRLAAGGMCMLARVFRVIAERKPDLDAGVYAYARARGLSGLSVGLRHRASHAAWQRKTIRSWALI